MFTRRRLRSIAALAALLVSWTVGPGAAFCVAEEVGPPEDAHHAHAAASAHGSHGMHHAPEPAGEERAPAEAPACPWMAMSGGSCLVASAPALAASMAPPPPLAEYPHPETVRDQLLAGAHFRPPKG